MIILPAIDIRNGKAVRLFQGDFSKEEQVADSPLETAISFQQAGAQWLHMVDLDGALAGELVNSRLVLEIAQKTHLQVEVGGGIRSMTDIAYYLERGIDRVILGSIALKSSALVREAVQAYGDKIAVGIDARGGMVAAEGWVKNSTVDYIELARRMEDAGVASIIFTDIERDGTLSGPNIPQLEALNSSVGCNVIASGGIHTREDITALKENDLYGAICGKSLYKGTLDLKDAISLAE